MINAAMVVLCVLCVALLVVAMLGAIIRNNNLCRAMIAPLTLATMYAIAYTIKMWN